MSQVFILLSSLYKASAKEIGGSKKGEYYYFGQAKNLPGVKELLEQREKKARISFLYFFLEPPTKSRSEMAKTVTTDYYGFRDEEDPLLVQSEKIAEEKCN